MYHHCHDIGRTSNMIFHGDRVGLGWERGGWEPHLFGSALPPTHRNIHCVLHQVPSVTQSLSRHLFCLITSHTPFVSHSNQTHPSSVEHNPVIAPGARQPSHGHPTQLLAWRPLQCHYSDQLAITALPPRATKDQRRVPSIHPSPRVR